MMEMMKLPDAEHRIKALMYMKQYHSRLSEHLSSFHYCPLCVCICISNYLSVCLSLYLSICLFVSLAL